MVSELRSYAAALTGTGADTPIIQPPIHTPSMAIPQKNSSSRTHRNLSAEELENPLRLGINESPSAVLVGLPLAGSSNYGTWNISMRIALEVKNKWSLVDGSLTPPNRDQHQHVAWRRCNLLVCSWLFQSVQPSIAQSVMHLDNAKDVWEDLRRKLAQRDAQRISMLK
ncbi:PREDICTED: uncharacterized protein LOC109171158 [Ipomoea nil]|uniref:uncharacterized protein LOC109171158 n=1 Tax=Ipomoea nil TaxID=35883 RepID=UPI0009012F21|nr:PREDICTED: uncharacterized protein LOC109171158 [Ipomoea nil]